MPVPRFNIDKAIENALVPNKRLPKWLLFMKAIALPYKRLQNLFIYFRNGSVDMGYWDSTTAYAAGDLVRNLFGVHESQTDGNLNNPLGDTTNWLKVLNSFIGVNARARFTGAKLTFEYALNDYFNTTFRQPTTINPGVGYLPLSDIYITTDSPVYASFGVATQPQPLGELATIALRYGVATKPIAATATTFQYTIHIPVAVYNALGATGAIRESIVRQFADLQNPLGMTYEIVTY